MWFNGSGSDSISILYNLYLTLPAVNSLVVVKFSLEFAIIIIFVLGNLGSY